MPAAIKSTRLIIGMEIHVELATRSKMFTRAANVAHPDFYDAEPNSLVDPVVAALPGTLPVMNRRAVEMAIQVGLALGCSIARESKWDRKNYFYPDLPKGYQISQYDLPLCYDGRVEIPVDRDGGGTRLKPIGIVRAHLEEDTGKLGHELPGGGRAEGSLVDLNRAGTPLLEIVTEPDFADAGEAVTFARELRSICRFLGVTEGVMQRGHMRFEPNINVEIVTEDGRDFRTPIVEIKNLNSFRALHDAILHEYDRQVRAWREDGLVMGPGMKSTRGWDEHRGETVLQREKEDAHDYRYFPEPDLVPVHVDEAWVERLRAALPELPRVRRERYEENFGLDAKDAAALVESPSLADFFDTCADEYAGSSNSAVDAEHGARACAKLLLNTGAKLANERGVEIAELGISPRQVVGIVRLREADEIGSSSVEPLYVRLCEGDEDARAAAEAGGLLQVRDEGQLRSWCLAAIEAEPEAVGDYQGGKPAAIGRLIGRVMQESKGQADAKAARACLQDLLKGL